MGSDQSLFERFGRTVPANTVIFREGDHGADMYIIQSGSVRIAKKVRNIEKTLVVLDKGEFFGEMSILNDKPRSASAITEEDCDLLVIDRATFESMVKSKPEIALRIIKKLSARLQEADHQIENLLIKDNTGRVVNHLGRLAAKAVSDETGKLDIVASPGEISNVIGVPPDQVKTILLKLAKAHMVDISTGKVLVTDMEQLLRFSKYLDMKDSFADIS
jgi:CRP-like cAMP-binding protein